MTPNCRRFKADHAPHAKSTASKIILKGSHEPIFTKKIDRSQEVLPDHRKSPSGTHRS
jgi:hypothetical protein